jgi:hypothetical protein
MEQWCLNGALKLEGNSQRVWSDDERKKYYDGCMASARADGYYSEEHPDEPRGGS